jgi:Site-specific recombinase XerD
MPQKIVRFPVQPGSAKEPAERRNKRSDGRVQVSYVDDLGKRHYFYGSGPREATKKMDADKQIRNQGADPAAGKQKLAAWATRWLDVYGQNAGYSTNKANKLYVRKLIDALGKKSMNQITEMDIQEFANSYAEHSKSMITKLRCVTNQVFARAVSNRILPHDPCLNVNWSNSGEGSHRAITVIERDFIVQHWAVYRTGLWAMLMLFAGLRRGEALGLLWSDVDLDAGVIHVRRSVHFEGNAPVVDTTKTSSGLRDIPMLAPLKAALQQAERFGDYVCCNDEGKMVTSSIWSGSWDCYLATMTNLLNGEKGIQPGRRNDLDNKKEPRKQFLVRPHDLRHTFCTMLFDADVDVKTAQLIMGHAKPDITMKIYTHLTEQRKASSIDKLMQFGEKLADDVKMMSIPKETQ